MDCAPTTFSELGQNDNDLDASLDLVAYNNHKDIPQYGLKSQPTEQRY